MVKFAVLHKFANYTKRTTTLKHFIAAVGELVRKGLKNGTKNANFIIRSTGLFPGHGGKRTNIFIKFHYQL